MSNSQLESLIRRNAEACEQAKHRVCKCHCAGAFHGKPHSEEWIQKTIAQVIDERYEEEEIDGWFVPDRRTERQRLWNVWPYTQVPHVSSRRSSRVLRLAH